MRTLLDKAVETVRALPQIEQDEIARAMLALAGDGQAPEPIDPARLPCLMEGLAQAKRGERASPEQVDEAMRRFEK